MTGTSTSRKYTELGDNMTETPELPDVYFDDDNALKNPDRCLLCRGRITYIRNPNLAGTIVATCSRDGCSMRVWPAGWPEVPKPFYYGTGKESNRGKGARTDTPKRKAYMRRSPLFGHKKTKGYFDDDEPPLN
jgi:hypothetical protein